MTTNEVPLVPSIAPDPVVDIRELIGPVLNEQLLPTATVRYWIDQRAPAQLNYEEMVRSVAFTICRNFSTAVWGDGGATADALSRTGNRLSAELAAIRAAADAPTTEYVRGPRGADGRQALYYRRIYALGTAVKPPEKPEGGSIDPNTGALVLPTGGWAELPETPGDGELVYVSEAEVNPAVQFAVFTPVWSPVYEAGGAGPPGNPGPAGGYAWYAARDFVLVPVTAQTAPAPKWEFTVIDGVTFPGGLRAGLPFWTIFNGFLYTDVSASGVYNLTMTFTHTIGGLTFPSTRTISQRLTQANEFTWPLIEFSSRSVIEIGRYTAPDGTVVDITEEMLARPTVASMTFTLERSNGSSFSIDTARMVSGEVDFYQVAMGTLPLAIGPVGPVGAKGDKGDRGEQGSKGDKGDPGAAGAKGDKGDTGAKGDKGERGAKGDKGDTGAGVPDGGTQGQVLAKKSGADLDTEWVDAGGQGGSQWHASANAPRSGDGEQGDFWLHQDGDERAEIWEKTSATVWVRLTAATRVTGNPSGNDGDPLTRVQIGE